MDNARRVLIGAAAMALIYLAPQVSSAQNVPFHASGSDNQYMPATAEFMGPGKATHMGRIVSAGIAVPTPTANPFIFDWTATGALTAANGDQIFVSGGGKVFLMPLGGSVFTAVWLGEFTVDGGNGRFATVGPGPGPLAVTAVNAPFDFFSDPVWFYDFTIDGQINLGRRR